MTLSTLPAPTPETSRQLSPVIDWIDRELLDSSASSSGPELDLLLQLRSIFGQRSPGRRITSFYRLLPRLEKHYFLLGYRIRQWIAANYQLCVCDPLGRTPTRTFSIRQIHRTLPNPRNQFFEEAAANIPLGDIRIEIQPIESFSPTPSR